MRFLFLILVICVGIACFEKPAEAQNYPWCLIYGTDFGGKNCGFVTFQQCQNT
jgi:Protein of unknown function (DUF3551)